MDDKTLERLLIDRSLNELPPDAAALLDEFLESRPEAPELISEIETTLAKAREALGTPRNDAPLPPLSTEAIMAVRGRHFHIRSRWLGPLTMAACLIMAFWLGGRFNAGTTDIQSLVHYSPNSMHENNSNDDTFWSLRRLTARTSQTPVTQNKAIQWSSPVAWPQLGDRS